MFELNSIQNLNLSQTYSRRKRMSTQSVYELIGLQRT